ncbi:MAG: hypothetical protein QNJ54_26690 [Prochloraceae cyanobacterium]|nr:hypothetical protein [Prochloraceae cyanobacterium]
MKTNTSERWNIKLKVTSQERRRIQKEAIDLDLRVADYIKLKVLGDFSVEDKLNEGKSA